MKRPIKDKLLRILRILPIALCICLIAAYLLLNQDITVRSILDYAPSNPQAAAVFLILMYALKSLSIVFPMIVLNIAGGFLFSPGAAVFVNIFGVVVTLILPYWVGRFSGANFAEKLIEKYPKLGEILRFQHRSAFFLSFFLRAISCLPGDAVSMYLGAVKMPFGKYLSGSLLGTLPGIITATLIGTSVTEPSSPLFWGSILLTALLSVISFLSYVIWYKKVYKGKGDDANC